MMTSFSTSRRSEFIYFFAFAFVSLTSLHKTEGERILLKDVTVISLYQNQMTTARRLTPVPQLKCIGGSAGCYAFVPKQVHCYNKGLDGNNVLWDCKTNMDKKYRFGHLAISCEGFDYSDDPYVLANSCGLEYTINNSVENNNREYEDSRSDPAFDFLCIVLFVLLAKMVYSWYPNIFSTSKNNKNSSNLDKHTNTPKPPLIATASATNKVQPPLQHFRNFRIRPHQILSCVIRPAKHGMNRNPRPDA
ncbi:store-operated calcium entry-associated regulatory factor-like [Octopus sinensis]|uniref:Store-operated calcium entry-associated regulatory factor n=1 Tax=Octopus sinensis TaxID=2607531 RepID=A0A6P7TCH5_9MOLL|nr:store-operated calcium entry-associated regulatory factor-like [Octopus sinensis]